jgi:hypothetical protein
MRLFGSTPPTPHFMKKFLFLAVAFLFALLVPAASFAFDDNTFYSTVYLENTNSQGEYQWGSGFFISIDGIILTNAHVVTDPYTGETLDTNICTIEDEYSEPWCYYRAEFGAVNTDLDLALLWPAYGLDENKDPTGDYINSGDYTWPYLDFADTTPEIGDTLDIIGFPGASGSLTVTLTEGQVSGFSFYNDLVYYMRTDATINPGNSGGPALDANERVVGVTSAVSTTGIGGNYGYIIADQIIAAWFLQLADEGILREEYVNHVFSNDFVDSQNVSDVTNYEVFTDVDFTTENAVAIDYLKENGIISGYDDGSFKPTQSLNRAELLKILVEGAGYSPSASYKDCFPDVNDEWYARYICFAQEKGWISGYPDGSFQPASNVNKAEALKMALEVMGVELVPIQYAPYYDVGVGAWYGKYVFTAYWDGYLEEGGTYYYPSDNITRGGVSEVIYRILTY